MKKNMISSWESSKVKYYTNNIIIFHLRNIKISGILTIMILFPFDKHTVIKNREEYING